MQERVSIRKPHQKGAGHLFDDVWLLSCASACCFHSHVGNKLTRREPDIWAPPCTPPCILHNDSAVTGWSKSCSEKGNVSKKQLPHPVAGKPRPKTRSLRSGASGRRRKSGLSESLADAL